MTQKYNVKVLIAIAAIYISLEVRREFAKLIMFLVVAFIVIGFGLITGEVKDVCFISVQ